MKSFEKITISKDEAFDILLKEFDKALSDDVNKSFSCRDNYSFHINSAVIPRGDVTTMLYEFSKKYSITNGLIYVVHEYDTVFKIK